MASLGSPFVYMKKKGGDMSAKNVSFFLGLLPVVFKPYIFKSKRFTYQLTDGYNFFLSKKVSNLKSFSRIRSRNDFYQAFEGRPDKKN